MYQALYRKWRPQTFDEVVGQKHITETLKNQVKSGRLSHAYIFIGTRGTGKTTCARILARAVNCENPINGNPCGKCPSCLGIADGSVMDVVELDAASNNGVDNVRALREEAVFSPAAVKKRVYIIDEVHMLSLSAFNALLKILEEPPEHLMFILATTELQKVPATILSRCQRHSFRRIDVPQLAEYMEYVAKSEHFGLTHDAAELIARMADGGVRDALSLLDQCSAYDMIDVEAVYSAMGLAGNLRIMAMLSHILRHDTVSAVSGFNDLWMEGKDPAVFLKELGGLLRDVLIFSVAPENASALISGGYDISTLEGLAARMTREELICAMETVQRYSAQLREAKNPKTVVELCLISLCDNTLGEDINALRARVSRLEAGGIPPRSTDLAPEPKQAAFVPNITPIPHTEPKPDPTPAPASSDDVPPREEAVNPPWEEETTPPPSENDAPPLRSMRDAPHYAPAPEIQQPTPSVSVPDVDPESAALWSGICAAVAPKLPPDLRITLENASKVRGTVDGNTLKIECLPGFVYGRFNRQEVLERFAHAARSQCGRDMRVVLEELNDSAGVTRNVEELKQFKEVRFI